MKSILDGVPQGIVLLIIGGLLTFASQKWVNSDLEYKVTSRDAYLSDLLGQQGLNMAFKGKPLKNVSVVEFDIFNRTSEPVHNAELIFSIDEKASALVLLSDITPPRGMSKREYVEPIAPKDQSVRKFRLKMVPKMQDSDSFHAVFVFEGEKAPFILPHVSSGKISVVPYQEWKNTIIGLIVVLIVYTLIWLILSSLINYIWEPIIYKKRVRSFLDYAKQLQNDGQLNSDDSEVTEDAGKIYASFIKPKPSKFWPKILPVRKLEEES